MAASPNLFCSLMIILLIWIPNSSHASASSQVEHYIIFMESAVMPKVFPTPFHWHLATLSSLEGSQSQTAAHASAKLIYSYSHAIDGFSCALTVAEFQALQKSPGYVHSIKDLPVKYDTTHSPEFLGLVSTPGRSGAWEASNYGEGVIIGVVDSGVWPESRSFDDHGMGPVPPRWKGECETGTQFNASSCNNKLIGARVFTRGRLARNMTITMNSPRDEEGHGTHTASTAAGNFVECEEESFFGYAPGTVKGVAPKAHVAMYKVDNGSFTSDYIAAIDWALRDGVDVLSLSLGFDDCALYDDAVALATFAAVDRNVFVATSAGNRGPMHGKIHNGIPWVLTVAAGTIGRELGAEVKLAGGGASVFGRSIYLGSYSTAEAPIVFLADCSSATEIRRRGAGRVVVCHMDKHTPGDPFANLQKSSGVIVGAIIISPSIIPDAALYFTFPVMVMTVDDGEKVKCYINSTAQPRASLAFRITNLDARPAPAVTDFSSRGPSLTCPSVLKPDIMGPGFLILAAWPPNVEAHPYYFPGLYTNFNIVSGTSMACPHLAGVGALLKKAHPDWSPAAVRSAIMTTADTTDLSGGPIQDSNPAHHGPAATGFAMGAGQVNPNKALHPGLVYDLSSSDYVNLLCAMNFTANQIRAITRSVTDCSSSSAPSSDLNYPSFVAVFNANRSDHVLELKRTLTNVDDDQEIMATYYEAHVTALDGFKVRVVPEKLVFKCKGDEQSFKLVLEMESHLKEEDNKPFLRSGYLKWIQVGGSKRVVQSPIVATNINSLF